MIFGKVNTRQSSQPAMSPPPIGGLNGRDPIQDMPVSDAYRMDNIFPGTSRVYSRNGYIKYSSAALGAPVQALEVFAGGSGDKLLAFANDKIFDASNAVAVQIRTGLLNALPSTAMFSNAADNSQHMIIVNGQNVPMHYDGAAITDLTITGVNGSPTTLNSVYTFKSRLFFSQKDRLGFYYLPVGQIQGAVSYFDLAQVAKLGGYLVAIASVSQGDAGDTPQDYAVFITSKGELIVYSGNDPSVAANWQLAGRYYAAEPIGKKCAINYGAELVILTKEGAVGFSDIRAAGSKGAGSSGQGLYAALTAKLGRYFSDLSPNKDVPGWMGMQYISTDGWFLLNAPASSAISGDYYQFVMNTRTKAWCRFTGWNGLCFAVFKGNLYFGRYDGYIAQGDYGRLDDTANINFDCKCAYNYFEDGRGGGQLTKHFQWAALTVSCDGTPPLSGKLSVDFVEDQPDYVSIAATPDGTPWDVGYWDTAEWGTDERTQRFIITLNKGGVCGSLWLRGSLKGINFAWYATQYVLQPTQGLL